MNDEPTRDPDAVPEDVGRRTFFRHLGRNAVRAAGNAAGTAAVVRRGSLAAAGGLLGFGLDTDEDRLADVATGTAAGAPSHLPGSALGAGDDVPAAVAPRAMVEYRSAYRLVGDTLLVLDQRRLPAELVDITCADASDVARAVADGAVTGAPVTAQIAAYGLYLSALRLASGAPVDADATIARAADALRVARPSSRPLAYAVDRMLARWAIVRRTARSSVETASIEVDALRAEADAIASESQLDHAKLARRAAASIVTPDGRPTGLLVHGSTGALAGGMLGTALGVVQRLVADGRDVEVWATEARPTLAGTRLVALELDRLGVRHRVIPDAAAGAVLASGTIDAVLVGAELVARNGDVVNVLGTMPLAAAAAAVGVPVLVCAPSCTIALDILDGASARRDAGTVGVPELDVTPAAFITALYTENGRVEPSDEPQLRAAYERSAQRRLPHGSEGEAQPPGGPGRRPVGERPSAPRPTADRTSVVTG